MKIALRYLPFSLLMLVYHPCRMMMGMIIISRTHNHPQHHKNYIIERRKYGKLWYMVFGRSASTFVHICYLRGLATQSKVENTFYNFCRFLLLLLEKKGLSSSLSSGTR